MPIPIVPIETVRECTQIEIVMPSFSLNATEGFVYVYFMTADGNTFKSERVEIPSNIYAEWGTDDMYIVQYAMAQLNIIGA